MIARTHVVRLLILSCIKLCSAGTLAYGQSYEQPEPSLETPYNTILNHLYHLQPESYHPHIAGITMPVSDSSDAAQLAIQLKQVFDGLGYYIDLENIPTDPAYFDSTHMQYRYAPVRAELPSIYVVKNDNDKWQYSRETIANIPKLHKEVYPLGANLLMQLLPEKAQLRFLGLAIWQYIGLLLLAAILLVFHWVINRLLRPIILSLITKRVHFLGVDPTTVISIARALSVMILIWLTRFLLPIIQLPIRLSEISMLILQIVFIITAILLAFRLIDVLRGRAKELTQRTESRMDEQLLPIITRIIKIAVAFIGIVHILNLLNVNVTALIAGLSIGGLALALAAQDTVKNLIGSIMILFDRPFQIGDYVSGGDIEGSVVEVGFRSTRIQTLDTSIVTVPNGRVADMSIKNFGVRTQRVMNETLTIEYSTPPDMIEQFTDGLKHIINSHPHTVKESSHVYLRGMADSSLQIMFRTFLIVPDYATELKLKEEILLDIMRLAQLLGIQWAFPSTSIYRGSGDYIESKDSSVLKEWKLMHARKHDTPDREMLNND